MRKNRFAHLIIMLLPLSIIIASCGDDDAMIDSTDYKPILESLTENVIVSTYADLSLKAQELVATTLEFQLNPTSENHEEVKAAWVATRAPWELSEGFLFGPVDTEGIDPALDSWPVNVVDLQNVLSSSDDLTPTYVDALEGTLKGFHTIEFLLWGADGSKNIDDFTARELEYLIATTEVLAGDAKSLSDAWIDTGENFGANVINAGESGSIYISQKAALEELANGILGIADEVGNGKINDPLEQEDLSLEESQFSDNSKIDFTNNIISIQNIYLGINGRGLSDVIAEENLSVDSQIRGEIQSAIDAIQAIPGTFTDAIPENSPTRQSAEAAQSAVRNLQATLESQLIPLISNL